MNGRKRTNRQTAAMALMLVILCGTVLAVSRTGTRVRTDDHDVRLRAYDRMARCMEEIKNERLSRGIALSAEDRFATGMIGAEWSGISTTLGDVQAKRTTANPDMAALCVELLSEAGLTEGDTIGVGASGSFPAMGIALLCACEETGVRAVVIPSVGSSAYGANNAAFSFPAMLALLVEEGLLSCEIPFATMGGDDDVGTDMDASEREAAAVQTERAGLMLAEEPDFAANLAMREDAYGDIDCFAGVGGNLTTLGKNAESFPAGLTGPGVTLRPVNENSGLLERYHARGLPVIELLNIKQLVAAHDLAFDPQTLPARGESAVFYRIRYPKLPILIALAAAGCIMVVVSRSRHRKGGAHGTDLNGERSRGRADEAACEGCCRAEGTGRHAGPVYPARGRTRSGSRL